MTRVTHPAAAVGLAGAVDNRFGDDVESDRPRAFLNFATYFSKPFFFSSTGSDGPSFCGELMIAVRLP